MKKNEKIKAVPEVTEAAVTSHSAVGSKPCKKRRFTRKSLIKVMFVISIIFIMISLTYSWFSASNSASVNGLNIQVVDPNNLIPSGIAASGELNSVAGDGTSFFKPVFESLGAASGDYVIYDDVPTGNYVALEDNVVTSVADEVKAENVFYVDFSLSINGAHDIYLVNGSSLAAKNSADSALNGALRMAILKLVDGKYEPILVWAPHSDAMTVVYPDTNDTGEGADGVSEKELTTDDDKFNDVNYIWGEVTDSSNIKVDTISGTQNYRAVVWLDGNDEACEDYSILGKIVTVTLKFLPEAVTQEPTE